MTAKPRQRVAPAPTAPNLLPGKPLHDLLLAKIRAEIDRLTTRPTLAIVQVGDHPASDAYVARKLKACTACGILGERVRIAADEGETALHEAIRELAEDGDVQGIIIQLPLPEGWDKTAALELIPQAKDVDGLGSANLALRRKGDAKALWPATPLGVLRLLRWAKVKVDGATACMVGNSDLVGMPLAELLRQQGAEVTVVDNGTPMPQSLSATADIVCVATGVAGLVTPEWIKTGAVVIDIGISRTKTKLVGDVAPGVAAKAGLITPVPGGVGPLTVASLLTNVVDAARMQAKLPRADWA